MNPLFITLLVIGLTGLSAVAGGLLMLRLADWQDTQADYDLDNIMIKSADDMDRGNSRPDHRRDFAALDFNLSGVPFQHSGLLDDAMNWVLIIGIGLAIGAWCVLFYLL